MRRSRKCTLRHATRERRQAGIASAWLDGYRFGNGIIDVDLLGLSQPPGGSFLGIDFHVTDAQTHDALYFRPFNFRAADSAQHGHAVQYVSHRRWTWEVFRSEHPGQYEAPVRPGPAAGSRISW